MTENRGPIPVVVNGAAGKMGREVIKAVLENLSPSSTLSSSAISENFQ